MDCVIYMDFVIYMECVIYMDIVLSDSHSLSNDETQSFKTLLFYSLNNTVILTDVTVIYIKAFNIQGLHFYIPQNT